jgi:ParB-like chromosome segregation protein Spo0J
MMMDTSKILNTSNRWGALEKTLERYTELRDSIKTIGIVVPIEVNENYEVVPGNGGARLEIAKELGLTEVPITIRRW